MKICLKCKETKDIKMFSKNKNIKDGLQKYCKDCMKTYSKINNKEYYEKHKIERRLAAKKYKKENPELVSNYMKHYRNLKKEEIKKSTKAWTVKNYHNKLATNAKRRATKLKATPKWLTKQQLAEIANIYKQAKQLEKETGLKYHVDHIIPLKGKDVCGLHTPWNLQIPKAEENIRKSNRT